MFIRKKKVNGKYYYYAVKSTRIDGKVKKYERYIGLNPVPKKELKKYEKEFGQIKIFLANNKDKLDKIKKKYSEKINNASKDELANIEENIITKFTYDTNRIEGSSLSFKDTKMLLQEGISPKEKPIRDIKEAENHKRAYLFIKEYISKDINEGFILQLHKILKGNITEDAGSFRDAQVRVGNLIPVNAKLVKTEIENLISWYNKNKKTLHALELATIFHCIFERIHPFFDGNGRVGRLLLNFILLKRKYPTVIVQNKNKRRYYAALQKADNGNYYYMLRYLFSEMEKQAKEYYS